MRRGAFTPLPIDKTKVTNNQRILLRERSRGQRLGEEGEESGRGSPRRYGAVQVGISKESNREGEIRQINLKYLILEPESPLFSEVPATLIQTLREGRELTCCSLEINMGCYLPSDTRRSLKAVKKSGNRT